MKPGALPVVNSKNDERYNVRFLVVKEDLTPLLSLNATQKMKLSTVHKENSVRNVVENANDYLTVKYADVFNKALGTLPGKVNLHGHLLTTEGLKPDPAQRSRR